MTTLPSPGKRGRSTMHAVLTITLNPAIDITTTVEKLVAGPKLRCAMPTIEPGGGGVNVSRVIKELGSESTALVAIGGPTGALMRDLLEQAGIESVFLEAGGLTRQSFAVHDRSTGEQFRFVLPGAVQDNAFARSTLAALDRLLADRGYAYVIGSGSLPPGLPDDFYGRIARSVRDHGARFILDTSGAPLAAAMGHGVFLVKPNHVEARTLARAFGVGDDAPQEELGRRIVETGGAEAVILTGGGEGAVLVAASGIEHARSPKVEVVSEVGAGDSFIGALSHALANGWSLEDAFRFGVASAAAAVTTAATELARKADIEDLYARMQRAP